MKKIIFYSAKPYEIESFNRCHKADNQLKFIFRTEALNPDTAILAKDCDAICIFVNDDCTSETLHVLKKLKIDKILLRCAGFNNVDIKTANLLGITIARVPNYSPHAVAEHTIALILSLNRKIHKAYNRTKENNFDLNGLVGFDLYGKTAGIIGTGNIGSALATILHGFGMRLLAYDIKENSDLKNLNLKYVSLEELLKNSDVISLHCPLTPSTNHLINHETLKLVKPSCLLVNTSRGYIIDTIAVLNALKSQKLGGFALDVYEHESDIFFKDLSDKIVSDDLIERLLTFPNVLLTGHQGFLTIEALTNIANTTIENIQNLFKNITLPPENLVQ